MKDFIKDFFNFDNLIVLLISSIGYGLGFFVPDALGCNVIVSMIICLVIGYLFDNLVKGFLENNEKASRKQKILFLVCAYILYLFFWCLSYFFLDHDLDEDLLISVIYFIVFYFGGIIINALKSYFKKKKA